MTAKLPNEEFTLLLAVANVNKIIRKRCTGRACTLRWHSGHHGALRSREQALRASAVRSFWHSLGWCEVLQAPAVNWETPYGSLPLCREGSWKALWATCSGMLWITRKVFYPAKCKGKKSTLNLRIRMFKVQCFKLRWFCLFWVFFWQWAKLACGSEICSCLSYTWFVLL